MPIANAEIKDINDALNATFTKFIREKISSFEVLKTEYIPEGLKPHTRSVCWLAEQVILQNVKKFGADLGVSKFVYPESDISPWDAKFQIRGQDVYVNIKVSDVTRPTRKNDIASVKTLLNFYRENPNALLFFVVIKLQFDNNKIHFKQPVIVRYYPWVSDFVVNVRNEHIQSIYEVATVERSTAGFITVLKAKAREKGLDV